LTEIVIDASVSAAWLLPDEDSVIAAKAFDLVFMNRAFVPSIWNFEICNIIVINERRGRLSREQCDHAFRMLGGLTIIRDTETPEVETLHLARKYSLTFYDAAYLELALRRNISLATLDKRLAAAALDCQALFLQQDSD
jgi:predicted nucleic acid-binding protein